MPKRMPNIMSEYMPDRMSLGWWGSLGEGYFGKMSRIMVETCRNTDKRINNSIASSTLTNEER
jgi:hypothetical protein